MWAVAVLFLLGARRSCGWCGGRGFLPLVNRSRRPCGHLFGCCVGPPMLDSRQLVGQRPALHAAGAGRGHGCPEPPRLDALGCAGAPQRWRPGGLIGGSGRAAWPCG
ncbi:hypothetical protein NDU88_006687 [Pleurodeles waltl]|uniref:Secreted protein n=1 Tax=Pleurodeles waltl TaxID=8319 RepID=A0AAV7QPQ5_PLEWA|nr:hypothetical protein NDU88_006687 [Pleurodeles waltl]